MKSWLSGILSRDPEASIARRLAKRKYWSEPLDTPKKKAHAWFDSLIRDHGFTRVIYPNRHEIAPGIYRSSQPTPGQLRWFKRQGGRTVLALRGANYGGSLALERRATEEEGLVFVQWAAKAALIVAPEKILELIDMLRTMQTPVLIHCKSGADRMGFVAVIYAHVILGQPIEKALEQLSLRYGHIKYSRTGVLDVFFDSYLQARGDGELSFEDWLRHGCDSDAINASFKKNRLVAFFEEKILRRE